MTIREVFLKKSKHQYHQSQWEECVYDTQSWKEGRLLCESKFIPVEGHTSILKLVISEVFFKKPKCQYH